MHPYINIKSIHLHWVN